MRRTSLSALATSFRTAALTFDEFETEDSAGLAGIAIVGCKVGNAAALFCGCSWLDAVFLSATGTCCSHDCCCCCCLAMVLPVLCGSFTSTMELLAVVVHEETGHGTDSLVKTTASLAGVASVACTAFT